MSNRHLEPEEIVALAAATASIAVSCECARRPYAGWESLSPTFPEELLERVGKVSAALDGELRVEEYHPEGTNLWSENAPIALNYYPANRCEVWQCRHCQRCYLRYTEFGGYYVDRRMRRLQFELVTLVE
ncbi:MAG: hypothetical protein JWR21_1759 [Herminiimonas sp.]|nr:hypothetical protein [Herminiimonas sp.]MDB5853361.1 hypothetical protein [Herminiimonas sp.]